MIEILPIRVLTDTDSPLFGSLSISLGKLKRAGLPVASGIALTPPDLILKTTFEHFDFGAKEVFQESLTLVRKEINKIPVPDILVSETGKHNEFLLRGQKIRSVKDLWQELLNLWLDQVKDRLWNNGFYPGITEGLEPKVVIFLKKPQSMGTACFDPLLDDVRIRINAGKLHPNDLKKITELVKEANKKLFMPYEYEWIIDGDLKLTGVFPYTELGMPEVVSSPRALEGKIIKETKSAVKVFYDLSAGFTIEKNVDPDSIGVDGIYIASEKIFDLNKPNNSFDDLVFKLVESAVTFPNSPVLFKLADKSEGMGKVRGTLRLLHQKSLFDPMLSALDFARHKKGLTNVHVVIPYVRGTNELLEIKRELAVKKLMRKNSLQIWMEMAVLENVVNLENYLITGIDGVVLNLDELIAHFNGFDPTESELSFYKNEVDGLIKFLEDGVRLLHKSKIPFIAYGSLTFYPKVLEFMVEKGVYGVVAERYEAHSAHDLLHQMERRVILRRT